MNEPNNWGNRNDFGETQVTELRHRRTGAAIQPPNVDAGKCTMTK
ncbi:MAG: hypothetical protein AB8G99_21355 [Planctomycetaceae bacterium]